MKNIHLHHIFSELSSKLLCPGCQSKIPVQNIELINSKGNLGVFSATCSQCSGNIQIHTTTETRMNPETKKMNESTRIQKENDIHMPLHSDDIIYVRKKLREPIIFSQLF